MVKNDELKFSADQSLSHIQLFVTPWTAACKACCTTKSWSLLKLMSIKLVMPSNHLILCRPLLLLPSIFSRIRAFSSQYVLHIWWPKYWSFSFSISPSNEYSGLQGIFPFMDHSLVMAKGLVKPSEAMSHPHLEKELRGTNYLSLTSCCRRQ